MFEEDYSSEGKTKKFLKIGGILILIVLVLFLIWFFVFREKGQQIEKLKEVKVQWPQEESNQIGESISFKLIKIEYYIPTDVQTPKGYKFLSVEAEYENRASSAHFLSFELIDKNGDKFAPIHAVNSSGPSVNIDPLLRKPLLLNIAVLSSGGQIEPSTKKQGYISFQVPENIVIKEVVIESFEFKKKVVFEIPPP